MRELTAHRRQERMRELTAHRRQDSGVRRLASFGESVNPDLDVDHVVEAGHQEVDDLIVRVR
jgi:hypothetical protein